MDKSYHYNFQTITLFVLLRVDFGEEASEREKGENYIHNLLDDDIATHPNNTRAQQ